MTFDDANKAFIASLHDHTLALANDIGRLLVERPFSLVAGATRETMDAIHFEYDWESFRPVALPLNTGTGYCGKGLPLAFPATLIPSTVEAALTEAMDNEDDDFCDELRDSMTDAYVIWFRTTWQSSRHVAPDIRGFLSVHDTIWRTDLDTGEVFREDTGPVTFF